MTAKSTNPAKQTTEAVVPIGHAEAAAGTNGTKAARGGTKGKPGKTPSKAPKPRQKPAVADTTAKVERKPRADTKQAKLIAMLQAKDGATVEEVATAFGWQTHTVRGALYGALKKKLCLDIVSEKIQNRGRVYRIGN